MDISKMYEASMAGLNSGGMNSAPSSLSPRSPAESPDINVKGSQDRTEAGSTSSGSNASPSLPYYQSPSGLLSMPQYPGQYAQATQGGTEFRRPLTVIF